MIFVLFITELNHQLEHNKRFTAIASLANGLNFKIDPGLSGPPGHDLPAFLGGQHSPAHSQSSVHMKGQLALQKQLLCVPTTLI